jgi:hypothetical protein
MWVVYNVYVLGYNLATSNSKKKMSFTTFLKKNCSLFYLCVRLFCFVDVLFLLFVIFFVNFYFLSMLTFSICFCGVSFLQNQPLLMQTYIWNEKELHCHLHLFSIIVNIQHFFIYICLYQHFFGIMHHSKSECELWIVIPQIVKL